MFSWFIIFIISQIGHDKRVHNTGSRECHNSHADDDKSGHKMKHEGYDKHSGTGVGKEVK